MGTDLILVRFGELSTKGKNIKDFIKKLGADIKEKLKSFSTLSYRIEHDHIYIELHEEKYEDVSKRLLDVPGIGSFSFVKRVPEDIEEIINEVLRSCKNNSAKTFKIITKRIDKLFPYHSDEVNRMIAEKVLKNTIMSVDVHNPELPIHIMIRPGNCYIYSSSQKGLGGYPVGIAGKSLMLLSGGIDSPVAAFNMIKRGVRLECIHFSSPPYTSSNVITKIRDILHVLNKYQTSIKLYIVPFTEFQEEIYKYADTSYAITIMRRMMLRISEAIARHHNCLVLSSGESVGQVASQTLKSIAAIEECSNMPIIRPLATVDKVDIINEAKKIGTYDISIRPFEDCCTIFEVKNPTTCPHLDKIKEIESHFDYQKYVVDCIANIKYEYITLDNSDEEF
ncbi:MAG TPA: tRNA 4-thiouridine(8) synthase ThiI [Firmicutes bacterium]|nr:tRNA 4-thiouridine(8) synthase ThiI [Bacillota bacterium]